MFKADVIYYKYHCDKDKGEGMKQSKVGFLFYFDRPLIHIKQTFIDVGVMSCL